jgi:hypothetical protein
MDEEVTDFCPCDCSDVAGFDDDGRIVMNHSPTCLFNNGGFTRGQWELLQSFRVGEQNFGADDDDVPDEYFPPDIINDARFARAISDFDNEQSGGVLTIGYGQSALKFKLQKEIKKSLNGGVQIQTNRVNLIQVKNTQNLPNDTPIGDVMTSFDIILETIIEMELKKSDNENDKFQVIIDTEHRKVHKDDSGMDHPISSKLVSVKIWKSSEEKSRLMTKLLSKIEGYNFITLGDNILIETVLIRRETTSSISTDSSQASGYKRMPTSKLEGGKSLVRIKNFDDEMCLARAVGVCLAKNEVEKYEKGSQDYARALSKYNRIKKPDSKNTKAQRLQALSVCIYTFVKPFSKTTNDDIAKMAEELGILIKVIDYDNISAVIKFGNPNASDSIYLLREKIYHGNKKSPTYWKNFTYHFHSIVNIKGFRKTPFYCTQCDISSSRPTGHRCIDKISNWCYSCWCRDCADLTPDNAAVIKCPSCQVSCRSAKCLQKHTELKVCRSVWCFTCVKRILRPRLADGSLMSISECLSSHNCHVNCHVCGRERKSIHKCYMTRQNFKPRILKFLFLDFETDQSSGTHLPVYCFAKWVEYEFDEISKTEQVKSSGQQEFGVNYTVCKEVGDFLFTEQSGKPSFKGFTVIAHNMKGFDGCFLLKYLIEHNVHVELIANGMKLTSITVPVLKMRLIDSLNFLQMPLSAMPAAMGLPGGQEKGHFPHFFTRPENLNFVGPLPPPSDYGFEARTERNQKFFDWYDEYQLKCLEEGVDAFDFDRDVRKYCQQDVEILMQTCLKFRSLVLDITKNIPTQKNTLDDETRVREERKFKRDNDLFDPAEDDPLEGECLLKNSFDKEGSCDPFAYLTAPGFCSAIFKAKFLKENSIA